MINNIFKVALFTGLLIACGETANDKSEDKGVNSEKPADQETTAENESQNGDEALIPNSLTKLTVQGSSQGLSLVGEKIEVTDGAGQLVGHMILSDARVVLEQIRLKKFESENETGGDDEAQDDEVELEEKEDAETTELALKEGEDDSEQPEESDESEEVADAEQGEDDSASDKAGDQEESNSSNLKWMGPYVVDLLNNTMTPAPEDIVIPEGLYRRIELRIHKTKPEELADIGIAEDDPIAGNSIYVAGEFVALSGAVKPFSMAFDMSEDFEMRSEQGFTIAPDAINDVLITFGLQHWFKMNDEETTKDGLGFEAISSESIVLDKDSDDDAKELRKIIKENIKNSAEMGKKEESTEQKEGESE